MRPTIEDQLRGAQRLLEDVEADSALTRDSVETLTNVRRLLKQVTRSWSSLLPFYTEDNAAMARLLVRYAQSIGPERAADIAAATVPVDTGYDVAAAAARNAELRSLLSRVIAELPRTPDGDAVRRGITGYLARRVEADPS
jgi:hypothetical protein